jgi:hypothetical protein
MFTHNLLMKSALLLILFFMSSLSYSQTKKTVQNKKHGYFTVNVTPDKTQAEDETRVTFTFIGPDNTPARSNIKIVCNNDSAWPNIDPQGNYTIELDPGKYKMRFSVPFWYEVKTDSILCRKQTMNNIIVHFQAKDNPTK